MLRTFVLAIAVACASAYPSKFACSRAIVEVGSTIGGTMSGTVALDTAQPTFMRSGTAVACGGTVAPCESLTFNWVQPSGAQYLTFVSGGATLSGSTCDGRGMPNAGATSDVWVMPATTGTTVSLDVMWAMGPTDVKRATTCTYTTTTDTAACANTPAPSSASTASSAFGVVLAVASALAAAVWSRRF
uniref:Reelin domain-containing protein n=2 Tax=Hemiselmis andersenii TaxID=464988 RepID=A0A7S1E881_HEMAN|mmetsp:Transcript_38952/g.94684  ORF Transcript_38952/g.94684 Transcript_38952/m.94684 type:complete len:188 (+) Transcript_38952:38-601(+)